MTPPDIRPATFADVAPLHSLIESAYRGESARAGWTHEADLVEGPRTTADALGTAIASPDELLLLAIDGDAIRGCVQISRHGGGIGYLGLLTVDPQRQAAGLGTRLIDAAEAEAAQAFGATQMELSVVSGRTSLIAYYERRGYAPTGERRSFPVPLDPPLELVVLRKVLK